MPRARPAPAATMWWRVGGDALAQRLGVDPGAARGGVLGATPGRRRRRPRRGRSRHGRCRTDGRRPAGRRCSWTSPSCCRTRRSAAGGWPPRCRRRRPRRRGRCGSSRWRSRWPRRPTRRRRPGCAHRPGRRPPGRRWPTGRWASASGTVCGETRRTPFSFSTSYWSSRVVTPPMPEAMTAPSRSGSTVPSSPALAVNRRRPTPPGPRSARTAPSGPACGPAGGASDVGRVDGDLGGDPDRQLGGPLLLQGPDAGTAGEQTLPGRGASPPSGVVAPIPVTTTVRLVGLTGNLLQRATRMVQRRHRRVAGHTGRSGTGRPDPRLRPGASGCSRRRRRPS